LELLIVLLERPGELVSKQELMARGWPNTFVEPCLSKSIRSYYFLRHGQRSHVEGRRIKAGLRNRGQIRSRCRSGEEGSSIRRASQLMEAFMYADPSLMGDIHARPARTNDPISAMPLCLLCRI